MTDVLITAGMLADRLRPIVLGGERSCLNGTPMIPLHRGTVSAIYQHLERLADIDGETTLGKLERALMAVSNGAEAESDGLASAIEARRAAAENTDAVHESAVPNGQTPNSAPKG